MKSMIVIGVFAGTLCLATGASAGQCADPWVTQAIQAKTGHAPRGSGQTLDCNINLYGGGKWSSYADLLTKVGQSYRDPLSSGSSLNLPPTGSSSMLAPGARPGANGLIANDGASMRGNGLIANDGASARPR